MSRTVIKVGAVLGADGQINSAKNTVSSASSSFSRTASAIDSKIKNRSNIRSRLSSTQRSLSRIEADIANIRSTVNRSANLYSSTEDGVVKKSKDVINAVGAKNGASVSALMSMFKDERVDRDKVSDKSESSTDISFNSFSEYFDVKDFIKDGIVTSNSIYQAIRGGLHTFDIRQVGDYIRIYGKRKPRSKLGLPQGNRVKVGSSAYFGKGYALWFKNSTLQARFKSSFYNFGKDTFFSKASIVSYAAIAVDSITNLVGNVQSGASVSKTAADFTTDVVKGVGGMAASAAGAKAGAAIGAAIGSIFPGPGTVIGGVVGSVVGGAIAGFGYDYLVDGGVKIGGKSVAGWVSDGLEKAYTAVGDAVKSGVETVSKVAVNVKNTVCDAVSNVAKSVGDAVNSAAKGIKNFFGKVFA